MNKLKVVSVGQGKVVFINDKQVDNAINIKTNIDIASSYTDVTLRFFGGKDSIEIQDFKDELGK